MRKTLIVTLLAVASFAHGATADPVKVGVVLSLSGSDSIPGQEIDRGLDLYLKLHQKDLPAGVTIEMHKRDDGGANPDVAKRLAAELITRDHVQILTGALFTPNAIAIAPLATEAKIPFIIANAAGVTIPRLSPYVVRVSFTLWQTAYPLGQYTAQHGKKTGYTAVSDYTPGIDAEGGFTKGFTEAGGSMAGSVRMPLGNLNYVPYLQRIADAKPDVVYIFVPVGEAPAMMRAVANIDFNKLGIEIVSTMDLVPDEQLPDMGDAALGLITSGTYSAVGKRPQNAAFVAAWQKEYGAKSVPDFTGVQGWDAMAAIFAVVKGTNGKIEIDKAMDILSHWKDPDSPRGPIEIDPATRDIIENIYMRKVEKVGGRMVNVEFDTIPHMKDPWKEFNPPK
jgi:branched-chain amino acid transport system substrate-binding protein